MKKNKSEEKVLLGEVFALAKCSPGLSQEDALALAESKGLRLISNREADLILQDDKFRQKYYDYWPFWTNTKVEIDGAKCTIKEYDGRVVKKKIPLSDGWYLQDEFGLPFGKKSSRDNSDARYLWRISKYFGLVARGDFGFDGRVVCCVGCDGRLGVFGSSEGATKNAENARKARRVFNKQINITVV